MKDVNMEVIRCKCPDCNSQLYIELQAIIPVVEKIHSSKTLERIRMRLSDKVMELDLDPHEKEELLLAISSDQVLVDEEAFDQVIEEYMNSHDKTDQN